MGNLLSVHICRFFLNIHFSWAFILAKMLCKHQKDLKFRQNSWRNKLAFNGKHCWIGPGLLLCCFAQSFTSSLVWRLKVSLNGTNTEWGKLKVTVYPPLASWFRTPSCALDQWNRDASSHLCLFGRSPLHATCAFLFIYPTQTFTLLFFLMIALPVPCRAATAGPRPLQALHGYLQAPVWVALPCLPRPHAWDAFNEKKGEASGSLLWLREHLRMMGQPANQTWGMLPSVVQCCHLWSSPLRHQSLLAWDLVGVSLQLFFFFFNSFTVELYQVTQAKCVKAWKPWRYYLFIFTNPVIHQFSCSAVVLLF